MSHRVPPERIANSIRLLQADFSDADARERVDVLEGEIERIVDQLPPAERTDYLDQLAQHFPIGFGDAEAPAAPSAPPPEAAPRELTASEVVDRLRDLVPRLRDSEKAELIGMLNEIGLPPRRGPIESTTQFSTGRMDRLAAALGLNSASDVDPDRVIDLALRWRKFVSDLDVLSRNLWAEYRRSAKDTPSAALPVFADVMSICREYARADSQVPFDELKHSIERAYALIAGMLAGAREGIDRRVRESQQTFSPEAIRNAVGKDNAKVLWRAYEQLVEERRLFDVDQMRSNFFGEILDVVMAYVDAADGGSSRG